MGSVREFSRHGFPGTRDPISGLKDDSKFAVARGVVDGYGWHQNVQHTMAVLNATIDLPNTINLVGWSRGAITCFMIAHALRENSRTKDIGVNIFAFDPVPGPGNFDDPNKVTLPPNVKSYAAVVQQDERRKIFRPALISSEDAPGFRTKFYYMPGGHSTGVFRMKSEVGLIAAFLAHRFLQKHGTKLQGAIQLSGRDLCELYAKVRMDMAGYQSSGGGILEFLGRQPRSVPNKFRDSEYFVNDHHSNQFRKTFPLVWGALDRGVSTGEQPAFRGAINALQSCAPTTYLSLQRAGVLAA